jgi:hypothetical protein
MERSTLYLFYELLASLWLRMMQSALFTEMPPKYQLLVLPYPIYMSAASLRELSLRDLAVPKMPLILSSLETRMLRCALTGKLKMPY